MHVQSQVGTKKQPGFYNNSTGLRCLKNTSDEMAILLITNFFF